MHKLWELVILLLLGALALHVVVAAVAPLLPFIVLFGVMYFAFHIWGAITRRW